MSEPEVAKQKPKCGIFFQDFVPYAEDDPTPAHLRTGRASWFKRGLVAVGAVCLHLCIGSVYGFSKMASLLETQYGNKGWNWAFSIAIFFLGTSAALAGQIIVRLGPRLTAFIASICFPLGNILTGIVTLTMKDPTQGGAALGLTIFFYGCIGGIGLGMGYVSPVSTLVKWFPDKRGLATGLAVMGFGLGSLVYSYFLLGLNTGGGLDPGLSGIIIGCTYLVIMMPSFFVFLWMPHPEYVPRGYIASTNKDKLVGCMKSIKTKWAKCRKRDIPDYNYFRVVKDVDTKGALCTSQFWMLWFILFLNIHSGIAFLGIFYQMMEDIFNLDAAKNTTTLALTSVANCGGRFLWSFVSDYIGRRFTFSLFAFLIALCLFLMPTLVTVKSEWASMVFFLILYTCYGGGFAVVPAFIADLFGVKNTGAVHGAILTAWSLAGLVGPTWVTAISDHFKEKYAGDLIIENPTWTDDQIKRRSAELGYAPAMYITAGLTVIELILTIVIHPLPAVDWVDKDGNSRYPKTEIVDDAEVHNKNT